MVPLRTEVDFEQVLEQLLPRNQIDRSISLAIGRDNLQNVVLVINGTVNLVINGTVKIIILSIEIILFPGKDELFGPSSMNITFL